MATIPRLEPPPEGVPSAHGPRGRVPAVRSAPEFRIHREYGVSEHPGAGEWPPVLFVNASPTLNGQELNRARA